MESDPFLRPSTQKPSLSNLLEDASLPERDAGDEIDLPTAPLLDHSLFSGPDFDPSEFLLGQRHTALDDLRAELRAYLTTLRVSLVAVINSEYEAFIGLSLGLRQASVSSSLATIRRPVVTIRTEVLRVKDELETMREEMERVLAERKKVREAKALLRRLLEVEDAVDKVEGLLKLGEGGTKGQETDRILDSPAKRLERVAAEYSQMLYLVARAGDFPFVRTLDPRIARITSTLHLDLSKLLTTVLTRSASTSSLSIRDTLTCLLRTYASLGLYSAPEDIVRRNVVRPFVVKTIHRDVLSTVQSPIIPITPFTPAIPTSFGESASANSAPVINISDESSGVPAFYTLDPVGATAVVNDEKWVAGRAPGEAESVPLADLYNKILNFISRECGLLLDVAERTLAVPAPTTLVVSDSPAEKKRAGYEILTEVVWDEIATRLMSELGHVIFAAGRPSVFHQNYTLSLEFISRIESLAPSLSHLNTLRSHRTYIAFTKRFQLPVYFQLRLKEVVTSVERTIEGGNGISGGETFLLGESEAVWRALRHCWSDDVYLVELASRLWRLTLQLISRYRGWLNSVIPKYILPSSTAGVASAPAGGASNRPPIDRSRDRERLVAGQGSPRPGSPAAEDPSEDSTLRQLTVLIADSRLMEKKVLELFEHTIRSRLPGEEDSQDSSAAAVLREELAAVTSIVPSLSSQIITILTKRCAEHLKLVRSVASQVRASTRKGPVEPSYFVPNILKELRAYLTGPGKVIEKDLKTNWATAVVEEVASRYAAILSTQKKTEDSLRWLKKGRQGLSFFGRSAGATPDAASTDDDKVKLQMQLDVAALGQDAKTLGVHVAESRAFETLRNAIVDTAMEEKR